MTARTLARTLDHLAQHRRMILGRSVAAGVLGAVPVPVLDEWLQAVVRRGTIRKIAEARRVDLDEAAVRAVADGVVTAPSWRTIIGGRWLTRLLSRTMRRVLLAFTLASRADSITRSYAVGLLFDHYCTRLHVGAGLDAKGGKQLRAAIDHTVKATRGRLATGLVRRGLTAGTKAVLMAPVELADVASGGLFRRMLGKKDETAAEEVVESAVARATATSFLLRTTQAVEAQLTLAGQAWVDELVVIFEARLRRDAAPAGDVPGRHE